MIKNLILKILIPSLIIFSITHTFLTSNSFAVQKTKLDRAMLKKNAAIMYSSGRLFIPFDKNILHTKIESELDTKLYITDSQNKLFTYRKKQEYKKKIKRNPLIFVILSQNSLDEDIHINVTIMLDGIEEPIMIEDDSAIENNIFPFEECGKMIANIIRTKLNLPFKPNNKVILTSAVCLFGLGFIINEIYKPKPIQSYTKGLPYPPKFP